MNTDETFIIKSLSVRRPISEILLKTLSLYSEKGLYSVVEHVVKHNEEKFYLKNEKDLLKAVNVFNEQRDKIKTKNLSMEEGYWIDCE